MIHVGVSDKLPAHCLSFAAYHGFLSNHIAQHAAYLIKCKHRYFFFTTVSLLSIKKIMSKPHCTFRHFFFYSQRKPCLWDQLLCWSANFRHLWYKGRSTRHQGGRVLWCWPWLWYPRIHGILVKLSILRESHNNCQQYWTRTLCAEVHRTPGARLFLLKYTESHACSEHATCCVMCLYYKCQIYDWCSCTILSL